MPCYGCDECSAILCSTCEPSLMVCKCSFFLCESCKPTHQCDVIVKVPLNILDQKMNCYCCDGCSDLLCSLCDSDPQFCQDCPLFLCGDCIDDHEHEDHDEEYEDDDGEEDDEDDDGDDDGDDDDDGEEDDEDDDGEDEKNK